MEVSGWFGVRCVFDVGGPDEHLYEERVTIWPADDANEAIMLAEAEATEYAGDIDAVYVGFAQCYTMTDLPAAGAEVFSLIRPSTLEPAAYLDAFFDTGDERETRYGDEPD